MENWISETGNTIKKNKGIKKQIGTFLGIVLITCNLSLFAQEQYFPFPTETATWSEFCGHFEKYPYPHWEYITIRFFIDGDTTIDSKEYSLIYGYRSPNEEIDTSYATLMGGLREDSLKAIYFLPMFPDPDYQCYMCGIHPFGPEYVIYQFGLEVGDTAFVGPFQTPLIVSNIDSILIDSSFRKKYRFSSFSRFVDRYWIEGVGSSYGLFGPMCDEAVEGYVELLCYEDQFTNYSKYGYCVQWYFVSVPENQEKSLFTISTNLNHTKLNIKTKTHKTGTEIQLFNTSGNLVKTQNCIPGQKEYTIDINNLSSGLYLVLLLENGRTIDQSKVIINH